MRVYTFSEARQKLAEVLDLAKKEDVMIRRRGGEAFVLSYKMPDRSPFDVPGIDPDGVETKDIIEAVRYSRAQHWRERS
jgi:prevent-host-death family protein